MGLTEVQRKYLGLAVELISNGVPVFVAKPAPPSYPGSREFFFPQHWQFIDADIRHLEGWKPHDAETGRPWCVCAVTGFAFDVMDVDPRNGGNKPYELLQAMGATPPVLGKVTTPSGGFHVYTHRSGLRKFVPWTGIDYIAGDEGGEGRGFVYIPPTIRKGKPYRLVEPIAWEKLPTVDEQYLKFYNLLLAAYKLKPDEIASFRARQAAGTRVFSEDERIEVMDRAALIAGALSKVQPGSRDTILNKDAYMLGGMVSGSGLDESYAINILAAATLQWGVSQSELENWAWPKIERGIEQGKTYPIDIFAFEEDAFGRGQ